MKYSADVIKSRYKLVPRTLIFIEKDLQVLLIKKKKKNSFGYDRLNGIGGHIEKGEEPFESAKREILEETGLIIERLELVAIIFIEIRIDPGILLFVFKGEYPGGKLFESNEGELIWMKIDSIKDIDGIVKDLPFLLDVSINHTSGSRPIIGKYLYDENEEFRIVINPCE
ncbi:MAG: NUDIX domain-containing protein [Candidatus Lokiarchaeota archaeon]|nr:NUDIX domain-containing protein [Candidatus Lokiarchaeota archaeon]